MALKRKQISVGFMLLLGCAPADLTPSLESTAVPTVFQASWQSEQAGRGKVEYGPTRSYGYGSAWGEIGVEHSGRIFGIPAGETWHWRAVVETETGEILISSDQKIKVEDAPESLPELTVKGNLPEDTLFLFSLADQQQVVMVDERGRYRWWYAGPEGNYYSLRAFLSEETVFFQQVNKSQKDNGLILQVSLDGTELKRLEVPSLSHDFVETPFGLATLAYDIREGVEGDALIELDADGVATTIFSTWDHFDPETTGTPPKWSHANSIDYQNGRYLVNFRNFGSILSIQRAGTIDWGFSGDANSFTIEGPEFLSAHQLELQDQLLLVYANTWPDGFSTSVAAYSFDEEAQSAALLWRYARDPELNTEFYGSVVALPEGEMLVAWANKGQLEWVDSKQKQQWKLESAESIGYPEVLQLTENGLAVVGF
jgi:hypothetical protein